MSSVSPRYFMAIAEHSMCQPGRPRPIMVSQKCSPSLGAVPRPDARDVDVGQLSVIWEFRDAVINGSFALIRERFLTQLLNEPHHAIDVVGRARPMLGRFQTQSFAIIKKSLREFFGIFPNAHTSSSGIGDNAVVDIGKIHHLRHFESARLQETPQNVLNNK